MKSDVNKTQERRAAPVEAVGRVTVLRGSVVWLRFLLFFDDILKKVWDVFVAIIFIIFIDELWLEEQ